MKNLIPNNGTVKDVHSPAGQPVHAPRSLAYLPDCPVCRFGTPEKRGKLMVCIDCGAITGKAKEGRR